MKIMCNAEQTRHHSHERSHESLDKTSFSCVNVAFFLLLMCRNGMTVMLCFGTMHC